jgi:hypothetical protein
VSAYAKDLITVVRSGAILNSLFEFKMGIVVTAVTVGIADDSSLPSSAAGCCHWQLGTVAETS